MNKFFKASLIWIPEVTIFYRKTLRNKPVDDVEIDH